MEPLSLPNAMTEPESVTAPMRMPRYVSTSWIDCSAPSKRDGRIEEVREADEHGRESDQAVEDRDELGHLRHLHAPCGTSPIAAPTTNAPMSTA